MIDLAMNYKSLNIIGVQIFMDFKMQVHQNLGKPNLDFLYLEKFLSVWHIFYLNFMDIFHQLPRWINKNGEHQT